MTFCERHSSEGNPSAQTLIETLAKHAYDSDVRSDAAEMLGRMGSPEAIIAVPELIDRLMDRNDIDAVRSSIASALGRIGSPGALPAVSALSALIVDSQEDGDLRIKAAAALGAIGAPGAIPAVANLALCLSAPSKWMRRAAAESLAEIGGVAISSVVPALKACLFDDDEELRSQAICALSGRGVHPDPSALIGWLSDANQSVRLAAAKAFESLAPDYPHAAIPALLKCVMNDEWNVRKSAAWALLEMGGEATEAAMPILLHQLNYNEKYPRYTIESAVWRLGLMAVPALIRCLSQRFSCSDPTDYWYEGDAAAEILICIGPLAVPQLIAGLSQQPEYGRCRIARILGRMWLPSSIDVMPHLRNLLTDSSQDVREAAEKAMRECLDAEQQSLLRQTRAKDALITPQASEESPVDRAALDEQSFATLASQLADGDVNRRIEAAKKIALAEPAMASECVEVLISIIDSDSGQDIVQSAQAIQAIGLPWAAPAITLLISKIDRGSSRYHGLDYHEFSDVLDVIVALAPESLVPLVPDLCRHLTEWRHHHTIDSVIGALEAIGGDGIADAVPTLVDLLFDHFYSYLALSALKTTCSAAERYLNQQLANPNPAVRAKAETALSIIYPTSYIPT